jgi:hypothetical protein
MGFGPSTGLPVMRIGVRGTAAQRGWDLWHARGNRHEDFEFLRRTSGAWSQAGSAGFAVGSPTVRPPRDPGRRAYKPTVSEGMFAVLLRQGGESARRRGRRVARQFWRELHETLATCFGW